MTKIKLQELLKINSENTYFGCWLWTGGQDGHGYGLITIRPEFVAARTHRLSYLAFNGEIPEGIHVLHTCDMPLCINPEHLFLGTHKENMEDMRKKNRAARMKGEKNFHAKLTEAKVLKMREEWKSGRHYKEIASEYGIKPTNVHRILSGKSWSHI